MKKIALIILALFMLVGCSSNNVNNDNSEKIDLNKVNQEIKESNVYSEIKIYTSEETLNEYSIDSKLAEDFVFAKVLDGYSTDMYIIAKVKDDKIKKQIDTTFEALETETSMYSPENNKKITERLEENYKGYDVYIVSNNNEQIFDIIKKNIN